MFLKQLTKSPLSVLLTLGFVSLTAVLTWLAWQQTSSRDKPQNTVTERSPTEVKQDQDQTIAPPERTIATEWQWIGSSERDSAAATSNSTASFDVAIIYEALQAVRLDENGDVVLDDTALKALNETLAYKNLELTAADLEELQKLIRVGLPGKAGEQTAKVVGDYYQFLDAKKEFESIYETPQSQREYESEYEELVALRELYMGREVAEQLFAEEDKHARYMIESMLLAADSTLPEEERLKRQREIAARHLQNTPDIPEWDQRYAAFKEDKQYIIDASLSEEQKQQQIEQLLRQHFSEEEIATAKGFDEAQVN